MYAIINLHTYYLYEVGGAFQVYRELKYAEYELNHNFRNIAMWKIVKIGMEVEGDDWREKVKKGWVKGFHERREAESTDEHSGNKGTAEQES